jgi:hypothetical protein
MNCAGRGDDAAKPTEPAILEHLVEINFGQIAGGSRAERGLDRLRQWLVAQVEIIDDAIFRGRHRTLDLSSGVIRIDLPAHRSRQDDGGEEAGQCQITEQRDLAKSDGQIESTIEQHHHQGVDKRAEHEAERGDAHIVSADAPAGAGDLGIDE